MESWLQACFVLDLFVWASKAKNESVRQCFHCHIHKSIFASPEQIRPLENGQDRKIFALEFCRLRQAFIFSGNI
jgi:hypothetical protein